MPDGSTRVLTAVAPHLVQTQVVLPDGSSTYIGDHCTDAYGATREQILEMTNAARACADLLALYTDLGISGGMRYGMKAAEAGGVPIVRRGLPV